MVKHLAAKTSPAASSEAPLQRRQGPPSSGARLSNATATQSRPYRSTETLVASDPGGHPAQTPSLSTTASDS